MKLSKQTIELLQNFSTINTSILFLEGHLQRTFSRQKSCYAETNLAESIPKEFAIFDLSMFLGVLSLFKEPEIELHDTHLRLSEGRQSATYRFCNPELIVHPPKGKKVNVGEILQSFTVTADEMKTLFKAVSLYGHQHVMVMADGVGMYLRTLNADQSESDGASYHVAECDKSFRYVVSIDNLKLLPHDYDVAITSTKKMVFTSKVMDLKYIVACEEKYTQEGK